MFRRKRLPEEFTEASGAFAEVVRRVEEAKEAIVEVMPRARVPGRALGEGLFEFEDGLGAATNLMPGWRVPVLEEAWQACADGLEESLRLAEVLRVEAPSLPFDAMAFAIQDLIAPLDAFAEAAERFRALRTR